MQGNISILVSSLFLFCAFAAAPPVASAGEAPPLELGQPAEREIAGGERHELSLELRARRFVLLVVEQQGIDLVVRVYDPRGEMVHQVDSSGKEGPEWITFFNAARGVHRIEVAPFEDEAEPGRYTIEVARLEKAARTPSGKVDQLLAPWDRIDSPGAALAVARDGEIVYKSGYGSAQLEYGIPITPSTVFHVASMSKQFTAFAIALLAEQGKLSLDDDVLEHIPEIPDFGRKITLRQLIHHTSGLRDQWNLLALGGWRLDDVITTEHILTAMRYQQELNFDPGEEHLYCNSGYSLLAEVVARVTGTSFREWTTENIFRPLGMNHTHFHDDHEMIVPDRAYSYSVDGPGFRKSVLSYANVGATSLFTTVEDLIKWTNNLDTGTLGGEAVLQQVHERGILNNGEEISYAFGLVHGEHRGLRTVGHGGADAGFRTMLMRYPDQRFVVAVLSNLGGFSPDSIAREVAAVYLAEEMAEAGPEEDSAETVEVDAAVLDDYTGRFQLEAGLLVTITRDEAQLVAEARGRPKVKLIPESETTFVIREADVRVTFHREESGEVERLTVLQGGQEMPGRRVEPFEPTAEQLAQYAGDYYSPELGTFYSIAVKEDLLVALHRRHGEIELTPTTTDEFSGDEWYFGRAKFERDDDGGVTALRVSSGRVRNLRFERQPD
jgi:CubicO group peptidase (beta-lactamase class C family)